MGMKVRSQVVAGVDTHKDSHTVAILDGITGKRIQTATFSASPRGYRALLSWAQQAGQLDRIGVEGTGSYGAGLARFLRDRDVQVVEVSRPNRQLRRRRGKSDPVDAEAAARATLAGDELGTPKSQDGVVEIIRLLRVQRRSAMKARSQAGNQLHAAVSTAPEPLRGTLRNLPLRQLVARLVRTRRATTTTVIAATKYVLRGLATRWRHLDMELKALNKELDTAVEAAAPKLTAMHGVGTEVASALLVAAGDNPERLSSESSFAALCGVSPVDASSGQQRRHRLNRGGNRDANRALWVIAFVRFRSDSRTQAYAQRRMQEGMTKLEVIRCLKRYIAREVFRLLRDARRDQAG